MILRDYELCDTPWKKFRGLMFRKKHERPLLFVFDKKGKLRNSIHSFFVFFPFDAVWLDEEYRVIQVDRVKPFRPLVIPKKQAKFLVEMPVGKAEGLKPGEKIRLKPEPV